MECSTASVFFLSVRLQAAAAAAAAGLRHSIHWTTINKLKSVADVGHSLTDKSASLLPPTLRRSLLGTFCFNL